VRTAPVPHSSYSRNSQVPRPPCLHGRRCEELPHPCLLAAATISYLLVSSPPCSSTQRHGRLRCAASRRPSETTSCQAHRKTPAPHQATTHASTSWWSHRCSGRPSSEPMAPAVRGVSRLCILILVVSRCGTPVLAERFGSAVITLTKETFTHKVLLSPFCVSSLFPHRKCDNITVKCELAHKYRPKRCCYFD
jgi:hypothetical protein